MEIVLVEASAMQEENFSSARTMPPKEAVIEEKPALLDDSLFLKSGNKQYLQEDISLGKPAGGESHQALQGATIKTDSPKSGYLNPAPVYPSIARKRGWEGTVVLKVLVEQNGTAGRALIEQSSGYKILDETALNSVKTWKFQPPQEGLIHKSSWVTIPIQFRLIE